MTKEDLKSLVHALAVELEFGISGPLELYEKLETFFNEFRATGLDDELIKEAIKNLEAYAQLLKRASKKMDNVYQLLGLKD